MDSQVLVALGLSLVGGLSTSIGEFYMKFRNFWFIFRLNVSGYLLPFCFSSLALLVSLLKFMKLTF